MKVVKVTTNFPKWPLEQQTPGRTAIWGDYCFLINRQVNECDYWVVFDDLLTAETCFCPKEATVLITAEPPNVRTYAAEFIAQFSCVVTAHRGLSADQVVIAPPALPWHVGRHVSNADESIDFDKDYDYLSSCPPPDKKALLSVIASDKALTPQHEYRLKFVELLKAEFGRDIEVFGRGIRHLEDKWDAIAPYRYHVVLENAAVEDYWTEKITDTYLCWSYPLYMGCPNLERYFPAGSFTGLQWGRSSAAIAAIAQVLDWNPYESSLPNISAARRRCLDEYNFFPFIARLCDALVIGRSRRIALTPERQSASQAPRAGLIPRLMHLIKKKGAGS